MLVSALHPGARDRLVVIGQDEPLTLAARLLGNREAGLAVVSDAEGRMIGVVSKTDIVARICSCSGSSCQERVCVAMTTNVYSCVMGDSLDGVWSRIKASGYKWFPVIDDMHRPIGLLNARDVLEKLLMDKDREESLLLDYVMGIGYQ